MRNKNSLQNMLKKDEQGNVKAEGGMIFFDTVANKGRYETELKKLTDIEVEIEPITITKDDISEIPTPNIMIALDGVVNFE